MSGRRLFKYAHEMVSRVNDRNKTNYGNNHVHSQDSAVFKYLTFSSLYTKNYGSILI